MHLHVGQPAPRFNLPDMFERPITLRRYYGTHLLLSFFRAPACPSWAGQIALLAEHYVRYRERGLEMIAFFDAPPEEVGTHVAVPRVPFPLIPDPGADTYGSYGVDGWNPRVDAGGVWLSATWQALRRALAAVQHASPRPADFLLGPEQTIRLAHYGRNAGDFLPLAALEDYAAALPPGRGPSRVTSF